MKAKFVYESLGDILKPKSQEEIDNDFLDKYGFVPNEKTLVYYNGSRKGHLKYGIEYYKGYDRKFWKRIITAGRIGKLSPLKEIERIKLQKILDEKIK